jgi:hypothetical protein
MRGDGGMFDLQNRGVVSLEQKTKYTPTKNVPMYRRKSFRIYNVGAATCRPPNVS